MQVGLHALLRLSALGAALVLAGCGGGGGGDAGTGAGTGSGTTSGSTAGTGTGGTTGTGTGGTTGTGTGGTTGTGTGGTTPPAPVNQKPVAVAAVKGESVVQTTTVFDTTGTTDPDGSIASRSWAYGDGESGTQDSHVYKLPGSYTAVLTVTDDKGATATMSVVVTVAKCSVAGTAAAAASTRPTVCMQTSMGEMVAELYATEAPVTVANFLTYVDEGFYTDTLFHRVIKNFMVQGGGYTTGLKYKTPTHAPIVLENNNGLKNLKYTLAMARTSVPNSATSQFFINSVTNAFLDYNAAAAGPNGYAVFGKVIYGTGVVDQISVVPTNAPVNDVPVTEVVIRSVVRLP